jgi:hypothetical protein
MKYLCLIYEDETRWAGLTPGEAEAYIAECMAAQASIQAGGHFLAGEALNLTATATTVRVRNGRLSATDGPFAETKEQLGGFYLVEASDMDEAIRVAAQIPSARTGSIEVRPVVDFGEPS